MHIEDPAPRSSTGEPPACTPWTDDPATFPLVRHAGSPRMHARLPRDARRWPVRLAVACEPAGPAPTYTAEG